MDELAHDDDEPVSYRKRVREYYHALGYTTPYRWLHFRDVPFTPLSKSLNQCRVAIVTTAAPYNTELGDQGPGASYNGGAKFFDVYEMDSLSDADLRISHIAYDRKHTSATDIASWFPLRQLKTFAEQGTIAEVAPKFFGLPTNRSHRRTVQVDCPELVKRVLTHSADAVILVPNCPVCHQSVSVAARQLEAAGIATVIMGCAKDIVEYVGVPRFVFSDFPLGNSAGKPHDKTSQQDSLKLALDLLAHAQVPRTTVQSAQRWSDNASWKRDYCNIESLDKATINHLREEFDRQKRLADK